MKCRICGADLSEQGLHEPADDLLRRKEWGLAVAVGYRGSYADYCTDQLEGGETVILSGGVDGEDLSL